MTNLFNITNISKLMNYKNINQILPDTFTLDLTNNA